MNYKIRVPHRKTADDINPTPKAVSGDKEFFAVVLEKSDRNYPNGKLITINFGSANIDKALEFANKHYVHGNDHLIGVFDDEALADKAYQLAHEKYKPTYVKAQVTTTAEAKHDCGQCSHYYKRDDGKEFGCRESLKVEKAHGEDKMLEWLMDSEVTNECSVFDGKVEKEAWIPYGELVEYDNQQYGPQHAFMQPSARPPLHQIPDPVLKT